MSSTKIPVGALGALALSIAVAAPATAHRGSGVLLHTQPRKRIALTPRPPDQRRCRF